MAAAQLDKLSLISYCGPEYLGIPLREDRFCLLVLQLPISVLGAEERLHLLGGYRPVNDSFVLCQTHVYFVLFS